MLMETLGDQRNTDQEQKSEGKHLNRRMALDKPTDRIGEKHHRDDRDDDAAIMIQIFVDHPDRRNHRIERKDYIEKHDLNDHAGKRGINLFRSITFLALERTVNFVGAFPDQKQAADQKSDRAPIPFD